MIGVNIQINSKIMGQIIENYSRKNKEKIFKIISAKKYPWFDISNYKMFIYTDPKTNSYSIYTKNGNDLQNGPIIWFYANNKIESISFFKNDTVSGWVEYYDTTGTIVKKNVPIQGQPGTAIYTEMFNSKGEIVNCWSIRMKPEDPIIETSSDSIVFDILACCDSCVLYEMKVRIINYLDTVFRSFKFVNNDTSIVINNLESGINFVSFRTLGRDKNCGEGEGIYGINRYKIIKNN